jgi:hypothetical protein
MSLDGRRDLAEILERIVALAKTIGNRRKRRARPLLWRKRTSGERVTGRATEERVSERENDGESH